ncbi:hypothetical protein R1flu_006037 [Riccia fluitans]|uniref:AB hydrolase-1 domain-containing protein n=1 Tax=Riccia fluitans TaxID=41844 RepID=A0ABD1YV46_9MARC
MMKKKKKIPCCVNAGCFSVSGGRRHRDNWSSELEYDKDYEKYGKEYEREYARLCELQRALTPQERSKRSEGTTSFGQSTFSRRYSSFDAQEISDERLDHEIKKITEQAGDEDSDYEADYENLMKEAEEAELLYKPRKRQYKEEEEELHKRKHEQQLAWKKREAEEEIERKRREELAWKERDEVNMARERREETARNERDEEIARIKSEEVAKRRREEEEITLRKRQEEDNARKEREEVARRKWAMEELERRKQQEEENVRIQREELARQRQEEEAILRRKRDEEENLRRQREEIARWKRHDEENERRKKMEEENLRRQKDEILNRTREKEEYERRRRLEEENLWKQKELARRKREEEENERRKRMEEEAARRQREEMARKKWEEEESAKKQREELARKEREEHEIARRREEQAKLAREQEEIERKKREDLERKKTQEEEEIARRKEKEEHMEDWQTQEDSSWMSVGQEAQNRSRGVSMNGEGIDRIPRTDNDRPETKASANGNTSKEIIDVKRGMTLKEGGYHNEWREVEFPEQEEQEEAMKLVRNRTRRGKQVAGDDYDDGASSSASELPLEEWDSGKSANKLFPPLQLVPGFQSKIHHQGEELFYRFEQKLLAAARIPKHKFHCRLNNSGGIVYGVLGVVLLISLFIFYLSFVARMLPPNECINERIILNFSATRIRLRGGRYLSFREQGVGADRAEHSVVVVHDLLSSRLAGIPGISESLLEEYKVRLISYDRPGYGQSDPHLGRNYNSSAYDIVEIADALNLGEKFWVVGIGGGGPHVWAAINYLPERLAGVAMFAPAGNPYVRSMSKEEIGETWGVLTMRQQWMHTIARRFPVLLPRLLQKTAVTDGPYVPRNVRLSLGQKDQQWMEQPHVSKAWQEDVKEALRHRCAFAIAEELTLLVSDWGFRLSELPFHARPAKTIFHQMVASFLGGEKKPNIFDGPIHIWQGTDDQMVPVTINNVAKRLVEQNRLLDLTEKSSPVKLHYLPGEGHFSWFWFCDECHRRIFQTLFRPNETPEAEEGLPFSSKGFTKDDYEAIVKAFSALKVTPAVETGEKTVENSATIKEREEELQKVLRNVLQKRKIEEEYTRQRSEAAANKRRFSSSKEPEEELLEVHPMSCRATNDALRDQSVLYLCPEDADDLAEQTDRDPQNADRERNSKPGRKGDNARETKNKTGNSRSTYLEGLSTLVKRLARHR